MTTSTAALGPSARMTHRTPAGHKRNEVREKKEELTYVIKISSEMCLRSVIHITMTAVNALGGSDEMMIVKEAQIR